MAFYGKQLLLLLFFFAVLIVRVSASQVRMSEQNCNILLIQTVVTPFLRSTNGRESFFTLVSIVFFPM